MSSSLQLVLWATSLIATFLWMFQLVFAYLNHRREKRTKDYIGDEPSITVVIPVFNEPFESVQATVRSILNQQKVKVEVIVIDDGSETPVRLEEGIDVRLIRLEKNAGKRHAQMAGIRSASHDWIATVDSDTVLDPMALYYLYGSVLSQKVEACSGSVFLSNEDENWLTKLTSCMYWFSFFQERSSQGYFGSTMCCSGAIALYRKSIIMEHEHEYLNQKFLGQNCVTGDDRHLTNLFLISGHRVGWSSKSIAYTLSPSTTTKFVKQQLRWVRSYVASLWFTLLNLRRCPFLFLFLTFRIMYRYAYMSVVYFSMIYLSASEVSPYPVAGVTMGVLAVTLVKSLVAVIYTKKIKFIYLMMFSMYNLFLLNPLIMIGALTPYKNGWGTRGKSV